MGIGVVPITLQTLGVIAAGAILGARKGAAAVLVFLALVAMGLRLLAGGRGGLGVFAGTTVGYIVGWVFAAAFIGAATAKILPALSAVGRPRDQRTRRHRGHLLLRPPLRTDLGFWATITTNGPFIPGDVAKVVIATVVAKSVHRAYPGLVASRKTESLRTAGA